MVRRLHKKEKEETLQHVIPVKTNYIGGYKMSYQNRLLNLLIELSYIIYYTRQKGIYETTQKIQLDDCDLIVEPIITHSFKLLSEGMDEKN